MGRPGWLTLAARLYLAYVFLLACWFKIADPPAFALSVATYQFLPLSLINITALVMPWTELLAGAMLLLGLRVRAAALHCADRGERKNCQGERKNCQGAQCSRG